MLHIVLLHISLSIKSSNSVCDVRDERVALLRLRVDWVPELRVRFLLDVV